MIDDSFVPGPTAPTKSAAPSKSKAPASSLSKAAKATSKSSTISQLSPLSRTKQPFPKEEYTFAADDLTKSFDRVNDQMRTFLHSRYHSDGPGPFTLHPNQGPFSIDIDDTDGSFSFVNSSGVRVARVPVSLVAELEEEVPELEEMCSPFANADDRVLPTEEEGLTPDPLPETVFNLQEARELRRTRFQTDNSPDSPQSPEEWFAQLQQLPISTVEELQARSVGDFPRSISSHKVKTGFRGKIFEFRMSNFKGGKDLRCSSSISGHEAEQKLLGFLVFLRSGFSPLPPKCPVEHDYIVPANFSFYVSVPPVTSSNQETTNPPPLSRTQIQNLQVDWLSRVSARSSLITDYGGRQVSLETSTVEYDQEIWQSLQDTAVGARLNWPDPGNNSVTIYRLTIHNWNGPHPLLSDSLISHGDAALKSTYYTNFFDSGLAPPEDSPTEDTPFHLAPLDFSYYPMDISEDTEFTCGTLFGKEELAKMSVPISGSSQSDNVSDVEMEDATDDGRPSQDVSDWVAHVSSMENALCDYGDRPNARLFPQTIKYGKSQWLRLQKTKDATKIGWPDPGNSTSTVHRMRVANWAADGDLHSYSSTSIEDAALKSIYFSHFFDAGLAPRDCSPTDKSPYYLVPADFDYYPIHVIADPTLTLEDIYGVEAFRQMRDFDSADPSVKQTSANPQPAPSLKPSSYTLPPANDTSGKSQLQLLLSNAPSHSGSLCFAGANDSFLATAILEPDPQLHPIENMIEGGRIILASGQEIDKDFELRATHLELQQQHPPLKCVDKGFPTTYREIVHYMQAPEWQLTKVREGQKDRDGKQKKQGRTYSTIRIHSKFQPQVIVGYLKPDLDILNIGLTIKGVQLPKTEILYVLFGVNPDSCPEGLRTLIKIVYKMELAAAAKRGAISKAEAGAAELDDIFFVKKGIRTTKLTNPENKAKFSAESFASELRYVIALEMPTGRTPIHAHLLQSAVASGTLKEVISQRAAISAMPPNNGQLTEANSVAWMQKAHAQMCTNFHSDAVHLKGINDITKDVRTAWRSGCKDMSPYQRKTVNLNRVIRFITTPSGTHVFTAACMVLIGPNVGSTLVTSRRSPEVIALRDKIAAAPIPWLYWYMYEILMFDESAIRLVMQHCDPEELLLITDTDFDKENMAVTTPFHDIDDEFVRQAKEDGILLNLPSTEESESLPTDGPTAAEMEMARQLRLKDDATFTTKNSDVVSRVTGATVNTSGAASFRSTTTADANRDFRQKRLEAARLKAAETAASISASHSQEHPSDSPAHSQGSPASNGSAAAIPKAKSTSANLPSVSRDGGAPA